jgi:hypothetical protein
MRVRDRLEIRPAAASDEDELVALLDGYHTHFTFGPVFRDGGFRDLLARSPGMELESYRVARRDGRMVAALALWAEAGMKHTRIRRMNRRLRLTSRLVQTAGPKLRLPAFPVEGELLRFVYVRHAAHAAGQLAALAGLVRSVMHEVKQQELHFALFTCADGDPVADCLTGVPRTAYRYSMLAGSNSPAYEHRLAALENAPLYDDAALS